MGYRYLALLAATDSIPGLIPGSTEAMHREGLKHQLSLGKVAIFTATATPVLAVADNVIIGHLFLRDGRPASAEDLPDTLDAEALAAHLLSHCWGDYLLLSSAEGSVHLHVMRDPSGGVPCVYTLQNGLAAVTSDISLLAAFGIQAPMVNWDYVAQALVYPHVKTARTGLSGVRELLPGTALRLTTIETTVRQVWSPWIFVQQHHRHATLRDASDCIHEAVHKAVSAWANVDKSVLLELSGGLDSSIVAACLRDTRASVTCFNLSTPVPGADEHQYATLMAAALDTELHRAVLRFEDASFDFSLPPHTVAPGVAPLQHNVDQATERAAEVFGTSSFFSGGGGDTVFSYLRSAAPAADAFRERGLSAGLSSVRDLSLLHQCTFWKAGRLTLRKLLRPHREPFTKDRSFIPQDVVPAPPEIHPWAVAPAGALSGDIERIVDLAGTQIFRDITLRGTKRWMRLPLLAQPVVEACLKTPTWMWIAEGRNRAVAREAFASRLPPPILNRRSKGSFAGYSGAVYRRSKSGMREFLLEGCLRERGLLDIAALEAYLATELAPRETSFMRIFALCMVENWVRNRASLRH